MSQKPKFSICVPVSISDDDQLQYLRELFDSILVQTFSNFELIVSDDSNNNDVTELCVQMESKGTRIRHILNSNRGISQNLNHCIQYSTGEFVKILFQDDLFYSSNALSEIDAELERTDSAWYVSACNHFSQEHQNFYGDFFPQKSSKLLLGHNSISSPSVVTFRRNLFETFSEKLTYLLDCEWYLRMSHKHGMPVFGRSIHVTNRVHSLQATNWAKDYLEAEIKISKMMHSEDRMGDRVCLCN